MLTDTSENKPTIVFLGTYPPRECGIATFTQDLYTYCAKILDTEVNYKVAAFNLTPLDTYKYPKEVEWEIDQESKEDHLNLAKTINNDIDIKGVILQHEYGIYGGKFGKNIIFFFQNCKKPILVTFHTVLPNPVLEMRAVTEKIIKFAKVIVVLTETSKRLIEKTYPESVGKVYVIEHGIHDTNFTNPEIYKKKLELENHTIISTFGLLSRGKGIEYVIKSLPKVIKKHPDLLYLVLGETHPVIRRKEGESYRKELIQLVKKLNLEKNVKFYDQYLSLADLFEFLKATDIYISTSINPNQAVSGTLSYALGTGRPVISTEFAQAKEIVTNNVGRLVPIKNPEAFTNSLLDLLSDKRRLKLMSKNAYQKTRPMLWSNIAIDYFNLIRRTYAPLLDLDHLYEMTDDFGLFQFASLLKPDKKFGYTLDDNARALIVSCEIIREKNVDKEKLIKLINIYFNFIKTCQKKDLTFTNYINYQKVPTNQNTTEDLEEAQSRALWALSEVIINKILPLKLKRKAQELFIETITHGRKPTHLRARAFTLKALGNVANHLATQRKIILESIKEHADFIQNSLSENSDNSWIWFEKALNYNNGILPESLFIAGRVTKNIKYTTNAVASLNFLINKTFTSKFYRPIGHSHWYKKNKKRSLYDQQPEDPASIILALVTAYKNTHDEVYKNMSLKCFTWFLGNNSVGLTLYDFDSGGCFDGLHSDRVNLNEGAESLVSYLLARNAIKDFI